MHQTLRRVTEGALALCLGCLVALAIQVPARAAGTNWYSDEMEYAVAHDIIEGNLDGSLQPSGTLSRAMVATMLYRALDGTPVSKVKTFSDVSADSYYYTAVNWCVANGIASGTSMTTFAPDDPVTREQLAVFLTNATWQLDSDLPEVRGASSFADAEKVSSWAKEELEYCWTRGIMNGFQDGTFRPQDNTTRGEAVVSLVKELQMEEAAPPLDPEEAKLREEEKQRYLAEVEAERLRQEEEQRLREEEKARQEEERARKEEEERRAAEEQAKAAAERQLQAALAGTRLIAHKGYSAVAPENTLEAFDQAGKAGFWGAECDVWSTKDGQYVILHDPTLSTMCQVPGNVTEKTWAELQNIPIVSGVDPSFSGNLQATRIPLLQDYLAICRWYGMVPVIELKQAFSREQLQQILNMASSSVSSEIWFISFNRSNVTTMKQLVGSDTRYQINLLAIKPTMTDISFCAKNGLGLSMYYGNGTDAVVWCCHQDGVPVHFWTLDDPAWLPEAVRLGAVSITSDEKLY